METNDIFEYDTLKIYAKKQRVKQVIKNYSLFGWKLKENLENDKYEDICDLEFVRPHKIANKDELQLQQIYMEENLNNQAKLERNKNSLVVSLGLCFGVFGVLALVFGVLLFVKSLTTLNIVFGSLLCALGIILALIGIIILPKIYKKQKIKFNSKNEQLKNELKEITDKVKTLLGGENAN